MKISEGQIKLYKGGVYPTLMDYLDRKIGKVMSYVPTQNVVVPNADFVLLDSSFVPGFLAIGVGSARDNGGILCTELPGPVGTASINLITDGQGGVLNLVEIRNAITNDPLYTNNSRLIYALVQCSNGTVDGAAVGPFGSENTQLSFVYFDGTDTPVLTLVDEVIEFHTNRLYSMRNLPILMKDGGIPPTEVLGPGMLVYESVADSELVSAYDNCLMYCVETSTFYRYESTAGGYLRDGIYALNTGDGGNTRWLGAAGTYHIEDIHTDKTLALFRQTGVPSPLVDNVRAFSIDSPGNEATTRLLLHGNNGDGSAVFDDSSQYTETVTGYNGILQSDIQKRFGISSIYFDGVNQYLSVPATNLTFAADDFSIDSQIYITEARNHIIYLHGDDAGNYLQFHIDISQELMFELMISSVLVVKLQGGVVSFNEWHHVAVQRDGTDWYLYLDGSRIDSATGAGNASFVADPEIGGNPGCPTPSDIFTDIHGYWKLDENVGVFIGDSSGNGRNGTLNVGAWVAGKLGFGLQFTGIATNYVNCGAIARFENNVSWSMAFWMRCTAGAKITALSKMTTVGTNPGYRIAINAAGNMIVELRNADANRIMVTTTPGGWDDNLWHHVVVTYNGSLLATGVTIYVDSVSQPYTINNNTLTLSILNVAPFNISGYDNGSAQRWTGILDDCAVWENRVLSSTEVIFLYNASAGRYVDEVTTSYCRGYIDEFRVTKLIVNYDESTFNVPSVPYGVLAPYWILPDGSVVGLEDMGFVGTKQWGEAGGDLYRDTGRVDIYDTLGTGKESTWAHNLLGIPIPEDTVMTAAGRYAPEDIPSVRPMLRDEDIPAGLTTGIMAAGGEQFLLTRGVKRVVGLNTISGVVGDPVYAEAGGFLTLDPHPVTVGQILTKEADPYVYFEIRGVGNREYDDDPIWDALYGLSGVVGSGTVEIAVYDEGTLVEDTVSEFDFIGTGVLVDHVGTRARVFIPPPVFVSHFNTVDGSTTATVVDVGIASRHVAAPTIEGTPYKVGGWTCNNVNYFNCTNTGTSFVYSTVNACLFEDLLSTIEVNVYDANGVAILATKTTPAITGNYDNTSSNIRIQVTSWAPNSPCYQGIITVTVSMNAILPAGGRFSIEIVHNTGTGYTKTQGPLFLDPNPNPADLTGGATTIAETGGSVVTRFISGVEYYYLGSQFTVNVSDIDYINDRSYPNVVMDVDGSEYGLPTLNPTTASLTGWSAVWDDINDSYTLTTWAITAINFFTMTTTANVSARTIDWAPGTWQVSANSNILIETHNTANTNTIERFYYEDYRCALAANFDLPNQKAWTSNIDIGAADACYFNGGCERNITNFTSYNPNPGSQPDYSISQNATVTLIREVITDGLAHANARINITGTYSTLEIKMAKAWDGTSTGGSVWMNCLSNYNAGNFNFGNPLGGTGCRTGSGAGYVDITFGSQNTLNTSNTVYLRIGFTAGQRITGPLSMVFS